MTEYTFIDSEPRTSQVIRLLADWARASERWWYDLPGQPGLGCYGTGYGSWGVQTNQKYLAAMAMLAARGETLGVDVQWARDRALAALRFSLATHHAGPLACTDGQSWGHTWISSLGIERMMHGVHALDADLTDEDRNALARVLTSEADWLHRQHRRGQHTGVFGDPWNHTGKNVPESNLWNGALLWRAAAMYPDHSDADAWRERAHEFLINAVSVPADADDGRPLAGKPIRERFRGANFFPHYGLDHHGYLNVGYMTICVSNAAMLHFDLRLADLPRPESLDHHQADLWRVLRQMIFADARLARIGGDSRLRYTYCQEYLLPALLYAADHLGDAHASDLADRQLDLIQAEATHAGDGSFYGRRLAPLVASNPYYYTRLETDRANALGMWLAYQPLVSAAPSPAESFEASVAGAWNEPEHGAVLHRSPTRFASFSWRAHGLTQGLCLPPERGDLAEWATNLAGQIRFVGETDTAKSLHRRLLDHHTDTFPGGFVTIGRVMEGTDLLIPEGWTGTDSATHHLAFAALPDGHTTVGLQLCRVNGRRAYTTHIKGLRLNVPNDLYNGDERRLTSASATQRLLSPPQHEETLSLGSAWANVDDTLGVAGVYGARELAVHRSATRRGGAFASLFVDEICWFCDLETRDHDPGTPLLDVGWIVAASVNPAQTRRLAESASAIESGDLRGITLTGLDGQRYTVLANFGDQDASADLHDAAPRTVPPGRAVVYASNQPLDAP